MPICTLQLLVSKQSRLAACLLAYQPLNGHTTCAIRRIHLNLDSARGGKTRNIRFGSRWGTSTAGPGLRLCYIVAAMKAVVAKPARSFASDNNAGIHPAILAAISAANRGHAVGYGDDEHTRSAVRSSSNTWGRASRSSLFSMGPRQMSWAWPHSLSPSCGDMQRGRASLTSTNAALRKNSPDAS